MVTPVVRRPPLTVLQVYLHDLRASGGSGVLPAGVLRVLKSKACRTAVMFGDELSGDACGQLLRWAACRMDCQYIALPAGPTCTCMHTTLSQSLLVGDALTKTRMPLVHLYKCGLPSDHADFLGSC